MEHENSTGGITLQSWGLTDVGMKRRLNEDVFLIDTEAGVYLVADGMGGHAAGEVASRLAADEIDRIVSARAQAPGETWPDHWDPDRSIPANLLIEAIQEAHRHVTEAVDRNSDLKGMGTTVVAAAHQADSNLLVICHVGDSRAYLLRDGRFRVMTNDHSWVHEQISAGLLTEEGARSHPLKNVVTQALGGSTEPQADVVELEMQDGDLVLLCSDGLNSMLQDSEIERFLSRGGDLEEMARDLVVAANEQGGNDNITVVLLKAQQTD
ncbi:MAG: Stp1/IreP family PP2C-type Ser/Thr phosphatase [Acidobacteria bacterium]|nr:Stp1/IreP family PP2C-type Ser/Thr phosphatase [Acidobacteriota bacterium]